jgi:lysozyme family protein
MAPAFIAAYEATMLAEGGYVLHNVKGDRGGQTYAGIARNRWPQWAGWRAIDAGTTPDTADVRAFYLANFWSPLRLDSVTDAKVAASIYDFAVNAGTGTAAKLAQLTVGATPDGKVGPVTVGLINRMDPRLFCALFTVAKIARYRDIVRRDRTQGKFLLGWINRTLEAA